MLCNLTEKSHFCNKLPNMKPYMVLLAQNSSDNLSWLQISQIRDQVCAKYGMKRTAWPQQPFGAAHNQVAEVCVSAVNLT